MRQDYPHILWPGERCLFAGLFFYEVALNIPSDQYIEHGLRFKPEEERLRNKLMEWLPENIIDCHAHATPAEHVHELDPSTMAHMMSTFPSYSLEQAAMALKVFFPGKLVRTLYFAHAFHGIDHVATNEHLLSNVASHDRVALYGIPTDPVYTSRMLHHPRVVALKMYPRFFIPPVMQIYQYFTPEILEEAQAINIPIILHLPMMITSCRDQLLQLLADFPRLNIVLAHLGLPHIPIPGLEEVYRDVAKYPRVSMDTAMIPSPEVVAMALGAFGPDRIMYGSDAPLHLLRFVVYNHPSRGQRIAPDYHYHWVQEDEWQEYGYLGRNSVHSHWQAIGAIRQAIERLRLGEDAKKLIFHDAAERLYRF